MSALEPDLKYGKTLATFHSVGKLPVWSDKLIMKVTGLAITRAASFSRLGGRPSKPVAFFRLRLFNSLMTSASLISLNESFPLYIGYLFQQEHSKQIKKLNRLSFQSCCNCSKEIASTCVLLRKCIDFMATTISNNNLCIAWTGDFESLKQFVSEHLKLEGTWSHPGGEKNCSPLKMLRYHGESQKICCQLLVKRRPILLKSYVN